jgi:SPOR domain
MRFESFIPLSFLGLALMIWSPAHADKTSYSIKVGAFKELRYAINEVNKFKQAGLNVFYRREDIEKGGSWYRVYVEKYPERGEAEREAKRLKQRRLIDDYTIIILSEAEERPSGTTWEKADPMLVIKKITLSQEKGGTETLMIHSNRFFWPSVLFSLGEEIPKLVIDIKNAETLGKILSDPTLHGNLIKAIRNPLQKNGKDVKIILSLAADRTYEVIQKYDEAENIFNIVVGLKTVNGEP